MITQPQLREILNYDAETGIFTWWLSRSNRVKPGDKAGTAAGHGYLVIRVLGVKHYAHRLAWLYQYGAFPDEYIDHVNGNRADNRIANLREATQAENFQNLKRAKRVNKCGYLGVYKIKQADNRWEASIKLNRERFYLGLHGSAEEAHAAYVKAKRELHPFGTL